MILNYIVPAGECGCQRLQVVDDGVERELHGREGRLVLSSSLSRLLDEL